MLDTASTDTVTALNILSNAITMNEEKAPGNRYHVRSSILLKDIENIGPSIAPLLNTTNHGIILRGPRSSSSSMSPTKSFQSYG
jgi:hypothetical protein